MKSSHDIRESFQYGQYIRKLAFHVMKLQDDRLAPYGITSQQARALGVIQLYREQRGCCCQRDLERAFGLRGSSVTSLIQALEKRGYIQRVSGEEDARQKMLSLTEKGLELLDTFLGIFRETERMMVDDMTPAERSLLLELLERASKNLE